jgi:hypothetical protein
VLNKRSARAKILILQHEPFRLPRYVRSALQNVLSGDEWQEGEMMLIVWYVVFMVAGDLLDYFIGLFVEREQQFAAHTPRLIYLNVKNDRPG